MGVWGVCIHNASIGALLENASWLGGTGRGSERKGQTRGAKLRVICVCAPGPRRRECAGANPSRAPRRDIPLPLLHGHVVARSKKNPRSARATRVCKFYICGSVASACTCIWRLDEVSCDARYWAGAKLPFVLSSTCRGGGDIRTISL